MNTNIDSWRPSEDNSADPTTASTPAYYETEGSYINGYRTPLTISATSTPLSPSLSSLSRYGGRDSISPLTKQYRAKPYTTRSEKKRWSQGSSYYGLNVDPQLQPQFHSPQVSPVSAPTIQRPIQQAYLPPHQQSLPRGTGNYIPEHYERSQITPLVASPYIPSHCHPNHHHSSHYSEYSERPNLFSCLTEEQIPPPEADMNPEDPDMIPHEQALRFEGDLYTPRWVRGHGASREGWCGICKPGRWLVLKNSAFWYDKSFSHGVSAATCLPFNGPREMRRMDGNPDVWEGLCHQCNDWMPLVSNKKKGTTWYRHAYKCHTHNKVRDAPKRRREGKSRAKAESR